MSGAYLSRRFAPVVLVLFAGMSSIQVWAHGDVGGQVQALTERIQQEPRNAALYLQRGELQRHLQHWELANQDLDRAEQLDRKLTAVHLSRALLLLESGHPDRALRPVDRFLAVEPRRADAHETRGRILFRLARHAESEAAFSKAIELLDYPTPDLYLARNEAILARGAAFQSAALAGLDEGIARLGPVVTLELAAIELERTMKNWDGALRRVERQARVSPRKEGWLVRRGNILSEAGRDTEARQAYTQALTAIESLPERYRTAAATKQLEAQAKKQLQLD